LPARHANCRAGFFIDRRAALDLANTEKHHTDYKGSGS
jgi:hypothetical protein